LGGPFRGPFPGSGGGVVDRNQAFTTEARKVWAIMSFSIQDFVRVNRRFLIWSCFFGLLYLARKVFGLIFLTFILCFIFNNLILHLRQRVGMSRRLWALIVYVWFVLFVAWLLFLMIPRLGVEAKVFLRHLPQTLDGIGRYLDQLGQQQPNLKPLLEGVRDGLTLQNLLGINRDALMDLAVLFVNQIGHYVSYFFLGTLFSFLIVFDFPHLRERLLALRESRLHEVYEEMADAVVDFANVVGFVFQAQIFIALSNTLLTALGMWLLALGPIALLAVIVFVAGLIPVLGTFVSSLPILIIAFNSGGAGLAAEAGVMIVFVHAVETYILNPNIVSAMLKIHPLVTLVILYFGHTLFGFWGVFLGVPVSVFIYHRILLAPTPPSAPVPTAAPGAGPPAPSAGSSAAER